MINEEISYENLKVLGSLIEKIKKEYNIEEDLEYGKHAQPEVLVYGLRCAENALYNVLNEQHKFVNPKTDKNP